MFAPLPSMLLVGLGGALGAMARYGVSLAMTPLPNGFPLATLLVNVAGVLAMGLLMGWLAKGLPEHAEPLRLLLGVGILGGFTTFSAFSLEVVALMERGAAAEAAGYVVASVAGSVLALFLGLWLMRRVMA